MFCCLCIFWRLAQVVVRENRNDRWITRCWLKCVARLLPTTTSADPNIVILRHRAGRATTVAARLGSVWGDVLRGGKHVGDEYGNTAQWRDIVTASWTFYRVWHLLVSDHETYRLSVFLAFSSRMPKSVFDRIHIRSCRSMSFAFPLVLCNQQSHLKDTRWCAWSTQSVGLMEGFAVEDCTGNCWRVG